MDNIEEIPADEEVESNDVFYESKRGRGSDIIIEPIQNYSSNTHSAKRKTEDEPLIELWSTYIS